MNGAEIFIKTLTEAGIRYIFGVPGTTEVALMDVLTAQQDLQFVLTLHESIAVAMADGLARSTGNPGLVSVHATIGTANTLGMLVNSFDDCVPVVVTAGIKDQRALGTGVFCDSPYQVTDLLRQYTKWSWQVLDSGSLGRDLNKALNLCQSPVAGPVFIGIPENFWTEPVPANTELIKNLSRQFRGDVASINQSIIMLQKASNPIMIIGSEVGRAGALKEAVALAEHWQTPVFCEERFSWTNLSFPTDHPLYCGTFNPNSPLVKQADVVLGIGARMFMPMGYQENNYFSAETEIIQIHSDPRRIATHVPVALGIISDARSALQDILAASQKIQLNLAERKHQQEEIARLKAVKVQAQQELLGKAKESGTIKVQYLVSELSRQAAKDAVVVNEGIRSGFYLHDFFNFTEERSYLGYTGGCLGWGVSAAMGVQLAFPERQVIAFSGDGSFLFSPQALWTAAHYGIGIKTVICNNSAYMAVKGSLLQHKGNAAATGKFVGVDLTEPSVNYPALCQGFGVPAWQVNESGKLCDTINEFLSHQGPAVLEVVVDPSEMEKRPD